MNLEIEKYEGELRMLRERVVELEKEVAWLQYHYDQITVSPYIPKTIEKERHSY